MRKTHQVTPLREYLLRVGYNTLKFSAIIDAGWYDLCGQPRDFDSQVFYCTKEKTMVRAILTPIVAVIFTATILLSCSSHRDEAVNLHRSKARDFVEKQQFREALAEYQEVIKLDPRDDDAYYQ